VLFIISYLRFMLRLPERIMILFLVSGAIFIAGALGIEIIGGRHVELYGRYTLTYSFIYTCEEFLEMLGIVTFVYTLLLYISGQFKSLTIAIKEQEQD